jgi:hypothetical protein
VVIHASDLINFPETGDLVQHMGRMSELGQSNGDILMKGAIVPVSGAITSGKKNLYGKGRSRWDEERSQWWKRKDGRS